MEFENAFSRPGKVMEFGENDQGHGKVMKLKFSVWIYAFLLHQNLNILLLIEQKCVEKTPVIRYTHIRISFRDNAVCCACMKLFL